MLGCLALHQFIQQWCARKCTGCNIITRTLIAKHNMVTFQLHCRLGHDGVKRVLELVAGIKSLPKAFKDSLPDSFRSLLGTLEKEFGMEISLEIVYDICPMCYIVYRCEHKDCTDCPRCSSPRYSHVGGRRTARQQVTTLPCNCSTACSNTV